MAKERAKPPPDADDRPLTDEMLGLMRPASEVMPDIVAAHARGELQRNEPRRFRGPQKKARKVQTNLRLDADVVRHFKDGGRGWQTRLNDALRKAVFGHKAAS